MGEVYRAWDPRLHREVALNVLYERAGSDPNRIRRFVGEARAASALNHRPITAIQRAVEDGNDNTVPDLIWEPLITTHQHPEYPSGHSTNSSAMATVLTLLFGDNPGVPIVATSPRNVEFPRVWTTFSQGVDEVIDARIYVGFHFRTADETGARMGRQVAHFVVNHALRD